MLETQGASTKLGVARLLCGLDKQRELAHVPAKADSTRCHAVQHGATAIPLPGGPPSPSMTIGQGDCEVRAVDSHRGEQNPKAPCPALPSSVPPSRASGWLGRDSAAGPGLTDSELDCNAPLPTPRALGANVLAWAGDPRRGAARWGPGGLSSAAGGEAPEEGLTSATPRATRGRGGSRSSPPGCAFPPSLRPSR